jgi:deoxyribodipyrimidine photolyase-like uncharacterized protein
MKECLLACLHAESPEPPMGGEWEWDYAQQETDPRYWVPDEDEIEDDYVCPVHGRIDGGTECPRC